MIYGIKKIEKQFPGFEARWTGGQLFDVTELNILKIDDQYRLILDEFKFIVEKYWDYVVPPSEKIYLLLGCREVPGGRIENEVLGNKLTDCKKYKCDFEIAVNSRRIGDDIISDEGYFFGNSRGGNGSFMTRIQDLRMNRVGYEFTSNKFERHNILKLANRYIEESNLVGRSIDGEEAVRLAGVNFQNRLMLYYYSLIISFFYLNVKNIKHKSAVVSKLRSFYYPKAWGREYKVLSLSQTLTEHSPGPDFPPGYHVRGHFQRGHFKRKPHGVYWWNPHWRGDFSKGIVMKDYKVKAQ